MTDKNQDSNQGGTGRKIGRILLNTLFYCLIVAIIGGAILFAFSENTQKSLFGYRLYSVKTPSMTPQPGGPAGGFRAGDMVVVRLCDPQTVRTNDIITFVPGKDPNVYLTHRVVKVLDHINEDKGLFFVTKGDANPSDDPPVAAKAVIGKKVFSVPAIGGVIEFIRSNLFLCVIAVIAAIGLVTLLRMYFSYPKKEDSRAAHEQPAAETSAS